MRGRWLKKTHACNQPVAGRRGVDSVWRCKCGQKWEILTKRMVGPYEHVTWKPL